MRVYVYMCVCVVYLCVSLSVNRCYNDSQQLQWIGRRGQTKKERRKERKKERNSERKKKEKERQKKKETEKEVL